MKIFAARKEAWSAHPVRRPHRTTAAAGDVTLMPNNSTSTTVGSARGGRPQAGKLPPPSPLVLLWVIWQGWGCSGTVVCRGKTCIRGCRTLWGRTSSLLVWGWERGGEAAPHFQTGGQASVVGGWVEEGSPPRSEGGAPRRRKVPASCFWLSEACPSAVRLGTPTTPPCGWEGGRNSLATPPLSGNLFLLLQTAEGPLPSAALESGLSELSSTGRGEFATCLFSKLFILLYIVLCSRVEQNLLWYFCNDAWKEFQ